MSSLLQEAGATNASELRRILVDKKKDMELRENLAWEAVENPRSVARAAEFISDLSLIASGHIPINVAWLPRSIGPTTVYRASHIFKP
jgi:hypothetical protein